MWYAIVYNKHGVEIYKSGKFQFSEQATFWAESVMRGVDGARYQLFKA